MTAPERYRKKPVVIDAIQWTGENLRAVIGFTDGPPDNRTSHARMMWKKYEDLVQREGLKIYTLEGTMKADVGDYIIKGVKGEFYPCKPDIFAATYEPARILAAIEPQPDPRDEHFDDYAVRSFAKMMAAKMAASRAKGRGGWSDPAQCSVEYLRQLLYAHLDKGDPVDVANICMMLRHYEASTAHEYESSAMAAACASRDKVIARLVEALDDVMKGENWRMGQKFDANSGAFDLSVQRAALATAKAVQHD